MTIKYKLSDVAKDLNQPAKGIIELLEKYTGEIKKSGAILSEEELNLVFDYYTQKNQVKDFNEYFNSAPPAAKKKPERKETAEKKPVQADAAEKKPEKSEAPKVTVEKADKTEIIQKKPSAEKQPIDEKKKPTVAKAQPAVREQRQPQRPDNKRPIRSQKHQPAKKKFNETLKQNIRPEKQNLKDIKAEEEKDDVRRINTKTVSVDLDKYNERYSQLAPQKMAKDNFVRKQKLSQKSKQRGGKYGNKKRETEAQKLQRLALERARKQQLKVSIPNEIVVSELALRLKVTASEVIKRLMALGVMAGLNETVDFDTASLVAEELGAKVEKEVVITIEERLFEEENDNDDNLESRCPVVVVMGHVDHGKTSLLDKIRHADVISGEAGGITQHIGAYKVTLEDRKQITFLDTPGHEAFTAMRMRGANMTDIAILTVAADDGIMPQTVEAINHAKAANVSVIVAINKIDKPEANPERVKQELTEHGLVPEEWGGDVICVPVSAKTGEGIPELLEMVHLVAEVKELKANPNRMAKGVVVEAFLDKGRGPVATLLVQNGTMRLGDSLIVGATTGRVRAMVDDKGNPVSEAGPSTPVEITGLDAVPAAGDSVNAVENERLARELVEQRKFDQKEEQFRAFKKVTLDNLFSQIAEGEMKELPIIVKADVQGSVEAVRQSLEKLSNEEVRVKVIHGAAGAINRSDVMLANTSNAVIIGFNVRPDSIAETEAQENSVEMRMYRVIYDAIEDVEKAIKGMLEPKIREVQLGKAEVREVYKISSVGTVAGCYVIEGKVARSALIRLVREGIVIAEDKILSLKRFKDDQKEVAKGYECGIGLEKFNDIKTGDIFESFILEEYRD